MSGEADDSWEVRPLGDLFAVNTPGHWGDEPDGDGNVLVLRSTNFRKTGGLVYETAASRQFDERRLVQKRLQPGDIILERSGGSPAQPVGRARRFEAEGCYSASNFMQIMRPSERADDRFICYLLDHIYAKGMTEPLQKATTGIRNLDFKAYLELPVCVPPLDEQRRIADVLRSVEVVQEQTLLALDRLKDLKQGALHNALIHDPLPQGWRLALIEELGAKSKHAIVDGPFGSNLKSEHYRSSGIPVFQSGFVTSSQFKPTKYVFVEEALFKQQIRSRAVGGDILMAKIGAQAGRCAIIPSDHEEGIIAGNCLKITLDTDLCSNEFLHAVLTYMYGVTGLREIITETAQPAISLARLKKLQVPLPPLGEQHVIMEGVRALDAAYQAEVQKHSQLMELKSCLAADLLSGRVRVPA
ncbi:MAG: restriction endonuclease subunit S [Sphingorhabdus sp.]